MVCAGQPRNNCSATVHIAADLQRMPNGRSRATVEDIVTENRTEPAWRDPLSVGWQAHRRLMMLRLRWHESSGRRTADPGERAHRRFAHRSVTRVRIRARQQGER
jgi:hypothetical protein